MIKTWKQKSVYLILDFDFETWIACERPYEIIWQELWGCIDMYYTRHMSNYDDLEKVIKNKIVQYKILYSFIITDLVAWYYVSTIDLFFSTCILFYFMHRWRLGLELYEECHNIYLSHLSSNGMCLGNEGNTLSLVDMIMLWYSWKHVLVILWYVIMAFSYYVCISFGGVV